MLEEKAFLATINQVATLSLQTYGMTVNTVYRASRAMEGRIQPVVHVAAWRIIQSFGCL